MKSVKPKKFLGQHFLKDLDIAKRIADTVDSMPTIPIVEVGPGMGVLTQFLLEKERPLTVIELDRDSVPYLHDKFPQLSPHIIEGDFLEIDLHSLYSEPFCVVGNYPYNISSQIFFKVLDHKDLVPCCCGMIQKEVAERMAGKPGNKSYGILSVLLQAWYDIEYLFTVDEDAFNPPPKVKSAVVRLTRNERNSLDCDERLFKAIVKTTFNRRRKTIRNSIKPIMADNAIIPENLFFDKRPEQLSVQQFEELTNFVEPFVIKSLRPQE